MQEVSRLLQQVPEAFRFTAQLHRRLTHERDADLRAAKMFAEGLKPPSESNQRGAVLARFPFSFVNNPYSRAYLCIGCARRSSCPWLRSFATIPGSSRRRARFYRVGRSGLASGRCTGARRLHASHRARDLRDWLRPLPRA